MRIEDARVRLPQRFLQSASQPLELARCLADGGHERLYLDLDVLRRDLHFLNVRALRVQHERLAYHDARRGRHALENLGLAYRLDVYQTQTTSTLIPSP